MVIGQQSDSFQASGNIFVRKARHVALANRWQERNQLISGSSGATSKRESKSGFFAIDSYLSFLDSFGGFEALSGYLS
jgi:hypothetical protein